MPSVSVRLKAEPMSTCISNVSFHLQLLQSKILHDNIYLYLVKVIRMFKNKTTVLLLNAALRHQESKSSMITWVLKSFLNTGFAGKRGSNEQS